MRRKCQSGFTLIEALVAAVLVAIAVTGVLGGIRSLTRAEAKGHTADALQRLDAEKMDDLRLLSDPSADGNSGDFSDRGYPDITWQVNVETSGVTNLDQVTVTATSGSDSQALTTLMYVAPASTTTTSSTGTGAAAP